VRLFLIAACLIDKGRKEFESQRRISRMISQAQALPFW
jgi:hypothetical protein